MISIFSVGDTIIHTSHMMHKCHMGWHYFTKINYKSIERSATLGMFIFLCFERSLIRRFSLRSNTCKMSTSATRPVNKSCMSCNSVVPHNHCLWCPFDSNVKVGSLRDVVIQKVLRNCQIIMEIGRDF